MQISTKHLNFSARALKVFTELKIKLARKKLDKLLILCSVNLVDFLQKQLGRARSPSHNFFLVGWASSPSENLIKRTEARGLVFICVNLRSSAVALSKIKSAVETASTQTKPAVRRVEFLQSAEADFVCVVANSIRPEYSLNIQNISFLKLRNVLFFFRNKSIFRDDQAQLFTVDGFFFDQQIY